jgi:hypothetical protein
VIADLAPQPWDFTTHDGITTLTVIPAGLRVAGRRHGRGPRARRMRLGLLGAAPAHRPPATRLTSS